MWVEGLYIHRWFRYDIIRHYLPPTKVDQHWNIVNIKECRTSNCLTNRRLYRCFDDAPSPSFRPIVCLAQHGFLCSVLHLYLKLSRRIPALLTWLKRWHYTTTPKVPKRVFLVVFFFLFLLWQHLSGKKDVYKLKEKKKTGVKERRTKVPKFNIEGFLFWEHFYMDFEWHFFKSAPG